MSAVLSSNEVDLLRYSTEVDFLVSTFYKVNLYTVLSTGNEVPFPANIYFLLRYFDRNRVVTEIEMCMLSFFCQFWTQVMQRQ